MKMIQLDSDESEYFMFPYRMGICNFIRDCGFAYDLVRV